MLSVVSLGRIKHHLRNPKKLAMPVLTGAAASSKIDAWIAALPTERQPLAHHARELLLGLHPAIDERWAFGGPFVYCHRKIFVFFANDKAGFYLGMAYGAQLSDPHGLLTATDRALIRHYRVSSVADLESETFLELLGQQLDISAAAARNGKSGWSGQIKPARRR